MLVMSHDSAVFIYIETACRKKGFFKMSFVSCFLGLIVPTALYLPALVESETVELTIDKHWRSFGKPGVWRSPDSRDNYYSVCRLMDDEEPSQWLRSKFINVRGAKFVNIRVIYSVTECPSYANHCSYSFQLQAYHSDTDTRPDPSKVPFQTLVTETAVKKWSNRKGKLTEKFYNTLNIAVNTSRRGMYLAFYDQGICMAIRDVMVTYNFCMKTSKSLLLKFPRTFSESADMREPAVIGSCSDRNSQNVTALTANCTSDGLWNMGQNVKCFCKPGFEMREGECIGCPPKTHKRNLDNSTCIPCGNNSRPDTHRRKCECDPDYFTISDDKPCTGLPPAPLNVSTSFISTTTIHLKWLPSHSTNPVWYSLACFMCENKFTSICARACGNITKYFPGRVKINSTKLTISGLTPATLFKFRIYAQTKVNSVAPKEKWKYAEVFVKTKSVPLPPPPRQINATFVNNSAIHLEWRSPVYERQVLYKIACKKCNFIKADRCNSPCGNKTQFDPAVEVIRGTSVTITGLTAKSRFRFRVYSLSRETAPESLANNWKYAEVFIETTIGSQADFSRENKESSSSKVKYLVPICIAVTLCLLAFAGILVYWLKRKRRLSMEFKRTEATLILTRRLGSDPNYEDIEIPEDDRKTNKYENMPYGWEIPRCRLDLVRHLGSGNFGDVYKGVLRGTFKGIKNRPVAVKVTRDDAEPEEKRDFLQELEVMKSLEQYPHVVTLLGCCTRAEPYVLILEYLPYGDLLGYLRRSRGYTDVHCTGELLPPTSVSSKDLMQFAWMIADGMSYLAMKKIVHRDLAARNILVGDKQICKVSDFGLARNMQEDIYTRTKKATLPLKWMPPESLFRAISTTKSDVWSFGIVMWEIFTVGDVPYPQYLGKDVPALLQKGFRMGKPAHLKEELYEIMLGCWKEEPEERPTFDWLGTELKKMSEDMQEYINLDAYDDQLYVNFDVV